MTTLRRSLLAAAGALAATVPGCGGNDPKAASASRGPAPVPVAVATAATSDVPIEIRAVGTVEPVASIVLKPQVAGRVADVRFEEGAEVRAGDPLVLLDARPFEAALHAAEADLARDTALALDARQAANQIEAALATNAMSERSAQQARAAAAAAEASVKRDEAEVESARLELEYCTLRAPFDGRTGKLLVRRGSAVKANETEIVSLAQIAPIRVAFSVPEMHLADIRRTGADAPPVVRVQVPGSAATLEGPLTFLDNSIAPASGTIALMGTFPNEDRGLWPGQFVEVSLRTGTDRGAVTVPTVSIQRSQKGDFVFVVGADKTVAVRPVTVRRIAGDASVVSNGLQAGEAVVTEGHLRIVPGARVEPRDAGAEAPR